MTKLTPKNSIAVMSKCSPSDRLLWATAVARNDPVVKEIFDLVKKQVYNGGGYLTAIDYYMIDLGISVSYLATNALVQEAGYRGIMWRTTK